MKRGAQAPLFHARNSSPAAGQQMAASWTHSLRERHLKLIDDRLVDIRVEGVKRLGWAPPRPAGLQTNLRYPGRPTEVGVECSEAHHSKA